MYVTPEITVQTDSVTAFGLIKMTKMYGLELKLTYLPKVQREYSIIGTYLLNSLNGEKVRDAAHFSE